MAVAPDSSDMNFETNLVMAEFLLCLSERSLTPPGSSALARLTPSLQDHHAIDRLRASKTKVFKIET
jgi:hypothetical protein